MVIDPGDDAGKIIRLIDDRKLVVSRIVCTHAHFDHIGAVRSSRIKQTPQYCSAKMILTSICGLTGRRPYGFQLEKPPVPDIYLADGDEIAIGKLHFRVSHTSASPGGYVFMGKA
jgi:glyoxylase-like metal-dependent hydrolase (beta-lactamase superfamily II)